MKENFMIKMKLPFDNVIPDDILLEYENEQFKQNSSLESYTYWDAHKILKEDYVFYKIQNWLSSMGVYALYYDRLYSHPYGGGISPHTDYNFEKDESGKVIIPDKLSVANLNIYFGAENCLTRFWKIKSERKSSISFDKLVSLYKEDGVTEIDEGGVITYEFDKKDIEIIGEYKTQGPHLVNVGEIHSAYNPDPIGRWTLCMTLAKKFESHPLTFEEAKEIFKDYLDYES